MWVKICANTRLEDALLAARLGADAVGFVFAPSKRRVTAEQVAGITPHLPAGVERVGVFTDATAEEIARTAQIAGLDAVQLHGPWDEAKLAAIRDMVPAVALIPVMQWDVSDTKAAVEEVTSELKRIAAAGLARVLVDAKVGSSTGGTGVALDWNAARTVFEQGRAAGMQMILAGGLRPENVEAAIAAAMPWGVDVASGVEAFAGTKDPARLRLFLESARGGPRP